MITSRAEQELLATWWHAQYIAAARDSFPDICGDLELAVGFKLTSPSGKSYNNYYWPLVDGLYDEPRLHEATAWNPKNSESCPRAVGDGLCVATTINAAQSGGARFSTSAGHVLVYPATLAMSDTDGKWRVPWCVDVDCFTAQELIVAGCLGSADLGSADLRYANLRSANLGSADLGSANLGYANLGYANLGSADLGSANLGYADLGYADLRSANLGYANLGYADLRSANLRSANLGSADLRYADLGSADLRSANLGSADLRYANLRSANANQLTLWPTGFDHAAAGVIVEVVA